MMHRCKYAHRRSKDDRTPFSLDKTLTFEEDNAVRQTRITDLI